MAKADLKELGKKLLANGPRKVLPTPRRVRVIHNGVVIVDTTRAVHVWEHDFYPQFYIPGDELRNCSQTQLEEVSHADGKSKASIVELTVPGADGKEAKNDRVLAFYAGEGDAAGPLAGLVRIEFSSVDQWLEEESPVAVHPKDPFKRVDVLPSTRSIEVKIDGQTVANTSFAMHLYETLLPTRYYLPLGSVDQSVLRKSSKITACPYKGEAEYYDVVVKGQEYKDMVWYYRTPIQESISIAGLVCFYNEKVDIWLDGKPVERPKTHFA